MACSNVPKQVLPQVGKQALPKIFLKERPTFTPFTQGEFDKISITAKGKILKNQADWKGYADIADAAILGYRNYLQSLFDKKAILEKVPGEPVTPTKSWWQFWK